MDSEKSTIIAEEDDFELVGDQLALRPHTDASMKEVEEPNQDDVQVQLHPLWPKSSVLVSVVPPRKPKMSISHVPCDIVLCIDVSGSMGATAPLPTTGEDGYPEETGLSVLDLTKHAARTILQTLNKKDRLGLVTFASEAKVVYDICYMTEKNKKSVLKQIEALRPNDMTNLWHGIKLGYSMLSEAEPVPKNIQALYVLTDGQPNHMCPKQGYVPKLHQMLGESNCQDHQKPCIYTFGFGYSIRSGLLQSIAQVGSGTYSFIPDAGMIGTVFVHAVANLYATYATQATLKLGAAESVKLTQDIGCRTDIPTEPSSDQDLLISVGNIQYGQSRDLLVHYEALGETDLRGCTLTAELVYNFEGSVESTKSSQAELMSNDISLPLHVQDYHLSRTRICAFLDSLFPLGSDNEHSCLSTKKLSGAQSELEVLVADLKSLGLNDDANASLLHDLAGDDPNGQVRLALSTDEYWRRWGQHYLLSLLSAHTHQMCNSFKDPGPLQYGKDSPLFQSCRQELDNCFDNLPAPKPSITHDKQGRAINRKKAVAMSHYNRYDNPCFAGHCKILMPNNTPATSPATANPSIALHDLRPGMFVWTPKGSREVKHVVETEVHNIPLCRIGGNLLITPWHPIQNSSSGPGTQEWVFPADQVSSSGGGSISVYTGSIYSVLLTPDPDPDSHAVMIDGTVCVTLGHGILSHGDGDTDLNSDVRAHAFFGDHALVSRSLAFLPGHTGNGVARCTGVERDETGMVCGFRGATRIVARDPDPDRTDYDTPEEVSSTSSRYVDEGEKWGKWIAVF